MDQNGDPIYSYLSEPTRNDYTLEPVARNSILQKSYQQEQHQMTNNWRSPGAKSVTDIEPQFRSLTAGEMVRLDDLTTASQNMNQMKNTNVSVGKEPSKLTSTSSTVGSSTAVSVTATSSTSIILPTQCYAYTNYVDSYRLITWVSCNYSPNDYSLVSGWYRFSYPGGTQLVTTPVTSTCICGAVYGAWWNGTLPTTAGATTTGNICISAGSGSTCNWAYSPVSVTNCNGYYVNYLIPLTASCCQYYRYCTTP
ncbi:unnamed protein product [Didymodactylos carnosus]|uniref:Uncharacterized protein n=1 Tax=Didymodactylos carnosus TaxID=1234261 RepID=A0A815ELA7_9BILA|nr:unnamed protein product [Didymodactylos carnosus]CAF1316328.1 unnamed protein product [Didymodactylos carnosus]CAF3585320.1 unnamed protein product [Didymodactylos carnosus]CAF4158451.1 unnamed protein product [Didymodactylos carnosus]